MKRILITLLIAISLCSPILVFAQEAPPTEDTEMVIPIYFFANEKGNVLGITPISEDQFLWFYYPHALTTVSTTTSTVDYTYDNNGNLVSYGDWSNVWDYMNRLLQSVNAVEGMTTTYQYDQSGQRVKKIENGVVSI